MTRTSMADLLRRWWLPIVLGAYIPAVTATWNFPDWRGVPYPLVYGLLVAAAVATWRIRRGRPEPIAVAAVFALTGMVLTDVAMLWTQPLRDFDLYLKAGERWLLDAPVYMQAPLAVRPEDLSDYPFLYPPVTLPLFAALATLPYPLAALIWTGGSLLALVVGLRLVGVRGRWLLLLLVWPPVAQGLYVGNVAAPLFLLVAAAPWRAAALVITPIFKLYSAILVLWLLRREHLGQLARGLLLLVALAVVTAPALRPGLWVEWLDGLGQYQASLDLLPEYLYGLGLGRYLPDAAYAAVGGVVIIGALLAQERLEILARLGVATVVASPSLFAHGLLVAIPGLFRLGTPWLWLALGITAVAPGPAWFVALGIAVIAWFRPELRKPPEPDAWHPLDTAVEPWPALASERRNQARERRT
jgi:hypothetical protein